jgi:hypothetical protein
MKRTTKAAATDTSTATICTEPDPLDELDGPKNPHTEWSKPRPPPPALMAPPPAPAIDAAALEKEIAAAQAIAEETRRAAASLDGLDVAGWTEERVDKAKTAQRALPEFLRKLLVLLRQLPPFAQARDTAENQRHLAEYDAKWVRPTNPEIIFEEIIAGLQKLGFSNNWLRERPGDRGPEISGAIRAFNVKYTEAQRVWQLWNARPKFQPTSDHADRLRWGIEQAESMMRQAVDSLK